MRKGLAAVRVSIACLAATSIGVGVTAPPVSAAGLDVFVCAGPYALVDSNMPGVEGPMVLTICADVTNTSGSTCNSIDVYIGDGTTPGDFDLGTDAATSLSLLGGAADAHRFIPSLANGEMKVLMWQVVYPAEYDVTYDLTVWAESEDGCDGSDDHQVTTRSSISANANKLLGTITVNPPGGTVAVGNIVEVTVTDFDFGLIGAGYLDEQDAWMNPVGNLDFDPACFRLVSTETDITSIDPPYTMPYLDRLYFNGIGSTSPLPNYSNDSNDYVTYRFIALGTCTTSIQPYQEVASGQEEKYSGEYGDEDATITLTSEGEAIELSKLVDPLEADVGETLTWTITYTNTSDLPVGDPESGAGLVIIDEAIPADTEYVSGTAGCSGYSCIVFYSTDGGGTWTTTEPVPASDVNALRWYITEQIPADESGTVYFDTEVTDAAGPICNVATAHIGESEAFDEITICANAGGPIVEACKTVTQVTDADGSGTLSPTDTVEYEVEIHNSGNAAVDGVVYTDTPDANTTLLVGAVETTQGTVIEGNTPGDTTVEVDIGSIGIGETVTVRYRVTLNLGNYSSIANQGLVEADNHEDEPTDDCGTEEVDDPTETPVSPYQPPPSPQPRAVGGEAMRPDKVAILGGFVLLTALASIPVLVRRRLSADRRR